LLKPWLRLAADEAQLVFEYADTSWVLEGPGATALVPMLIPLLDGTRSVSQIISSVGEEFAPAVENALAALATHRLLAEGPPLPADTPATLAETVSQLAATDSSATRAPSEILQSLAGAHIRVAGSSPAATSLVQLLRSAGLSRVVQQGGLTDDFQASDLLVAAPADRELGELFTLNDVALSERQTWVPVLPFDGRFASVGPLIVPGETCCYECYTARKAAALRYADTTGMAEMIPTLLPTGMIIYGILASIAANIAVRWLGLGDSFLPGRLHAYEVANGLELTRHDVLRVPRCNACSPAARAPTSFPWIEAPSLPDALADRSR
jgi:bacteriocin biosynthesis cyclodehydratase domain-containing protein